MRWYQAPEVVLGPEGSCGEPVDVWSVGCIFGEMLGSRGALFPGESLADQVRQTLAAVGEADYIERNGALGYELGEDVLKFLRTLKPPSGPLLERLVPPEVNEGASHLLKFLLDMNTRRRLTVPQALGHAFFGGCPQLPTAAASVERGASTDNSIGNFDEGAIDFSFEDDDLTIEELGELIAAEAEVFKDTKWESRRRNWSLESDAPPTLAPLQQETLSLKGLLGVGCAQARRQDRETNAAVCGLTGLVSLSSHPEIMSEDRFSSMANLAEARDDGDDFSVGGSLAGSIDSSDREVTSEPLGTACGKSDHGGTDVEPLLPQAVSRKKRGAPQSQRGSAGSRTAISTEDAAATRIQETCRRRAAQSAIRNKRHSAREVEVGYPVEGRRRDDEEEHAASLIQNTHHRAAAIRRARTEHERYFQQQQFSFGPGFQQSTGCTTRYRDSEAEGSSKGSRESRARGEPSRTPSENEDERQKKSTSLAAKKEAAMPTAVASVPRLPISSSALGGGGGGGGGGVRVVPKNRREPLAILRQLRGEAEVQPKPKTDQFGLRMTIKSAIEAHIEKTGAARRKPRPLPIVPLWRQSQQQQQRTAMTPLPLTKPRAISPLHRSVRQVSRSMAATDRRRGQPWVEIGPRGRPRSVPLATATGRLRCVIFAAEAERERERVERRSYGGRDDNAPVDESSRDSLVSPLWVPD
ncbi:unnamed protein product [Pylaiella littoralis]